MEYKFVTYNTQIKAAQNGAICSISFTEENTRNRVVATLKTHEQVRELIEQLKTFAHPIPSYGVSPPLREGEL